VREASDIPPDARVKGVRHESQAVTQYTIIYRGENPPGPDATRKIVYDITTDDQRFVVFASASGSAAASGRLRDADVEALLRRAALQEIEARLSAGLPPENWTSAGSVTTLFYDSPDVRALEALLGGRKACLWLREADPRGHICLAATADSARVTTPIGCERCQIPDSRLICGSLVFPEVVAGKGVGEESYRQVVNVRCEAAGDVDTGASCQPGGKECWRRTIATGRPAPQPDPGSPRRVVDEIGYLRLVYADRFELGRGQTKEFWPKSDESAVNSLRNPCAGLPDFKARAVALCQMFLAMKPHGRSHRQRNHRAGSRSRRPVCRGWAQQHGHARGPKRGAKPILSRRPEGTGCRDAHTWRVLSADQQLRGRMVAGGGLHR
jgi:hypothetical protein